MAESDGDDDFRSIIFDQLNAEPTPEQKIAIRKSAQDYAFRLHQQQQMQMSMQQTMQQTMPQPLYADVSGQGNRKGLLANLFREDRSNNDKLIRELENDRDRLRQSLKDTTKLLEERIQSSVKEIAEKIDTIEKQEKRISELERALEESTRDRRTQTENPDFLEI